MDQLVALAPSNASAKTSFSFFAIVGTLYVMPPMFNVDLHSEALANWSYWLFMVVGLLAGVAAEQPLHPFINT